VNKQNTPRRFYPSWVASLLLVTLFAAGCKKDDGDSSGWDTLQLSGEQTQAVLIPPQTRVLVDADVFFTTDMEPALRFLGEAEVLCDADVRIALPTSVEFPEEEEVRFLPAGNSSWRGLDLAPGRTRLVNVRIEGAVAGIRVGDGAIVELSGCYLKNCDYYGIDSNLLDSLFVRDTVFEGIDIGIHLFSDCDYVEIESCQFIGCSFGLRANRSTVMIKNCLFQGNETAGLRFHQEEYTLVERSTFLDNYIHIYEQHGYDLDARYNDFGACDQYSFYFIYGNPGSSRLHQNAMGMGRIGLYLRADGGFVDATENWWGTVDTTAIRDAIRDSQSEAGYGVVTFHPVLNQRPDGIGRVD
jgi:hypothetical protein